MNAVIIHESRGRMRLQCRLKQKEMSLRQADLLEAWFQKQSWTSRVTVHERTGCVILYYTGARETVCRLCGSSWKQAEQSRIPAGAQQPYAQPPVRGKAGGQSGAELVSTCSAHTFENRPGAVARRPFSAQRPALLEAE